MNIYDYALARRRGFLPLLRALYLKPSPDPFVPRGMVRHPRSGAIWRFERWLDEQGRIMDAADRAAAKLEARQRANR